MFLYKLKEKGSDEDLADQEFYPKEHIMNYLQNMFDMGEDISKYTVEVYTVAHHNSAEAIDFIF